MCSLSHPQTLQRKPPAHPPPTDPQSQVPPSSDHSAFSLLPAHGHHATPRGLVSIAELGRVDVCLVDVRLVDVQASAMLTLPQLPGPGPEQQSFCQQRGPAFELQKETESVLCHQTHLRWGVGVGREFQPCSYVNKQQEGNNKVERAKGKNKQTVEIAL